MLYGSFCRRELLDLVRNRIGFDTCREKIVEISRHENFVRTSHCPDPAVESMDGLLLDYDFVRFLKATEGNFLRITYVKNLIQHRHQSSM